MGTGKRLLGPLERIFPMPCVLVASGPLDNPGIFTAAWVNVVSSTPPTIAIGIRESRKTLEHIERTGCFSLNVPTTEMADAVDYLGTVSGKTSENKLASTHLTVSEGENLMMPIIDECPYNVECIVSETAYVGAYHVILAEIVQTHAEEAVLIAEDSDVIDIDALDPLIYIAGAREYRGIGPRVGDAYSIGKTYRR